MAPADFRGFADQSLTARAVLWADERTGSAVQRSLQIQTTESDALPNVKDADIPQVLAEFLARQPADAIVLGW